MLIEELYKQVEKLQAQQEAGIHNEVMIKFLEKAVNKLQNDVEKLKDKIISEDDNKNFEKDIQKLTDLNIENIEKILQEKEKEISQI